MTARCTHPVRSLRDAGVRDLLVRGAKIRALAALRLARWALCPAEYPTARLAPPPEEFPELVYERVHPLTGPEHRFHALLEEGKRVNLSLAAPAFDGLVVTPGRPLSFWRVLGRLTPARGYVLGASFADGCVIPAVGGGVCLLSNALFAMAARLGWRILERHGHTLDTAPPPPGDPWGLDATVLWPYVDLRVAPREGPARLEVRVRDAALELRVRSTVPPAHAFALEAVDDHTTPRGPDESLRENRIRRLCAREGEAPVAEVIALNRKRVRPRPRDGQSCLDCGVDCLVGRRARAEAGVE